MPGPPRKPTAIKAAEGNPGKRKLNTADLGLAPEEPKPPKWLDKEGRKVWNSLVPPMMDIGILRLTDQLQLANLCDAVSMMLIAREMLSELPRDSKMLVQSGGRKDAAGKVTGATIRRNPLLEIINRQREIIHRLCCEFGLTPAARARLLNGELVTPQQSNLPTLEEIMSGDSSDPRYAEPVN